MRRVLVFGTFDVLHPGHSFFLQDAKKHGDTLTVVVALDKTVEAVKGKRPVFNEQMRLANLQRRGIADEVVHGRTKDKTAIVRKINPDVVCLGYDQSVFVDLLAGEQKKGAKFEIIRLPSHKPAKHKSSKHSDHYVRGMVVKGIGEGKRLGYPTANIDYDPLERPLEEGVFAVTVWYGDQVEPGIAVVGVRTQGDAPLYEVYLLDFDGDLYGQELVAKLEYKIRNIEHFDEEEKLLTRIKEDIEHVHRNRPDYWDSIQS